MTYRRHRAFILLSALLILCLSGVYVHWYWPVSVRAEHLEKVISDGITEDQIPVCKKFSMSQKDFREFWKKARRIFDVEFHDYPFGSCSIRSKEDGLTYEVGVYGAAMVYDQNDTYFYVGEGVTSDMNQK